MGNDKRDDLKHTISGAKSPFRGSGPPPVPPSGPPGSPPPPPLEDRDTLLLKAWESNKLTMLEALRAIEKNEDNNRTTRRINYLNMVVMVIALAVMMQSNADVKDIATQANLRLQLVANAIAHQNEAELAEETLEDAMMMAEPIERVQQARVVASAYAIRAQIELAPDEATKEIAKKKLREVTAKAKKLNVHDDTLNGLNGL